MKLLGSKLIIGVVIGLVVGLLLGALLFYGLFPVKWTDAQTYDLAPDAKAQYLSLAADSYKLGKDQALVKDKYLSGWSTEEQQQAINDAIKYWEKEARADKVQGLKDLQLVLGLAPSTTTPAAGPTAVPATPPVKTNLFKQMRIPCLIFFLVLLVLVLGWIGVRVARKRRATAPVRPAVTRPIRPAAAEVLPPEEWKGVGQPPLGHFFTTYKLGEDTYDESFSIENAAGEFLGECGVGISETIGKGEPDQVTAFEVWLFDKSDIRTVTKVLMSDYAYNDEQLRAKLAPKGEAVLAKVGVPFTLETSGLQVQVTVTDLQYGEGQASPNSFFRQLTVELVGMAQPAAV